MTLIAAFKSLGVPILLGDFLLSSDRGAVGLRRKLRRINDVCAVGWTGHLYAAETILEAMQHRFGATPVSRDDIDAWFGEEYEYESGALEVDLIGWVGGMNPAAFYWRSADPRRVHWGGPWYMGSGKDVAEAKFGPAGLTDAVEPEAIDPVRSVEAVLSIVSHFMVDEAGGQHNRASGFGHAYELLYWADGAFRYPDSILYLIVCATFDETGNVQTLERCGPAYKYAPTDELALSVSYSGDSHIACNIITPLGLDRAAMAIELARSIQSDGAVGLRSEYYAIFVQLIAPNYFGPLLTLVQSPGVPDHAALVTVAAPGELTFRIPDHMLKWMYQIIRADQNAARGFA